MAVPGKLTVGSDGKVRGAATVHYNSPFPCVNGRYGSGAMQGVVMHTIVGNVPAADAVFNNSAKQASAHFAIAQDGMIKQYGPIGKGWIAWAQGTGNATWYSIEHADDGNPANPLTDAQIRASAQLVECLSAFAGFPLQVTDSTSGRGYGVHYMGGAAWGGHTCPDVPPKRVRSLQRPAIITLARAIRAGSPAAPKETAVTTTTAGRRLVMYDDVNVSLLPPGGDAYACYVNGTYANCGAVRAKFPGATILTIAVTSSADADCLDIEPGDATNAVAPGWVKRQQARGVARPVCYTSASNVAALLGVLSSAGIKRGDVRIWSAHYTTEHVCGTGGCTYPRADGTQWTHQSHSRELDQSLLEPGFFGAAPAPVPPPPPPTPDELEDLMPQEQVAATTVGPATVLSWSPGTIAGFAVVTDPTGPVTVSIQELHRKPDTRWVDKGTKKVDPETLWNIDSPDDCAGATVTLVSGTGASVARTWQKT